MVALFIIAAFLLHLTGEPTFSQTLGFDHDGTLELGAISIYIVVMLSLVLGSPLGTWLALKRGPPAEMADGDRRRGGGSYPGLAEHGPGSQRPPEIPS